MDRRTACIPKQQIGFYTFIARPMFEALDKLIPMIAPLANLDEMYEYWTARLPVEETPPELNASVSAQRLSTASPTHDSKSRKSTVGNFGARVSSRLSKQW